MSLVTKIYNENCLDTMSVMSDCFIDLIFTDPPYGLGSKIIIRPDGKPDYAKASDFMDKWDMPTGKFWETWFAEAFRILKFGGHCLMFGMDRQLLIYKYYANLAGFNENQSLYWYYACNDEKTELLTKRGWVNYIDIHDEDFVLTFNISTDKSEWQPILKKHVYEVENIDMVRFVNRNLDQLVTSNHRILHKSRTNQRYKFSDWYYKQAKDFLGKKFPLMVVPVSAENHEGTELFGEAFCHLLGWIFTDGNYQKGDNSVRICQSSSNLRKVNRIRDLLCSLGIKFSEYKRDRIWLYKGVSKDYTEHTFYFNNDVSRRIKELFPDKLPTYDLLNLTYPERYNLFIGMMAGDGTSFGRIRGIDIYEEICSKKNFSGCFYGKIYLSEFMQALATSLGFTTSLRNDHNIVIVNINKKHLCGIRQNQNNIFTENYTGSVWGLTIYNANYCIRRNGKVSFTGNSNFPKSSNLSKNLDKHFKADRKVVGKYKLPNGSDWNLKQAEDSSVEHAKPSFTSSGVRTLDITAPTTDLAKKYSGYKYSIAPLKQTNETILVFQKPYKTGSCMHDILAMESGDKIITCGALDIDGGRVPVDKVRDKSQLRTINRSKKESDDGWGMNNNSSDVYPVIREEGRYPSQVFCNDESAELIDKQSGVSKSAGGRIGNKDGALNRLGKTGFTHEYEKGNPGFGDVGGASKILHKCNFEPEELGDKTITCGALNIDGGRVPTNDELGRMQKSSPLPSEYGFNDNSMGGKFQGGSDLGRYPSQVFCNDESAELLDKQSGIKTSCKSKSVHPAYGDSFKFGGGVSSPENQYSDTGGCSKVLHKCNFEPEELKEVGCSSSGDSTITCGALNIDGGRVPIDKIRDKSQLRTMVRGVKEEKDVWGINNNKVPETLQVVREDGRYPAQTFCNSDASELLDNQSGERPSGKSNNNAEVGVSGNATPLRRGKLVSRNDTGGCSKVLDKCDYENEEYDIYNYCPKVSSKERGDSKHPTMKPISLITKILKLFIIPNQQVVYDPFTGTGSTGIACVTHKRNFIGSEISEEYCKIAEKRIEDVM